MGSSDDRPIGTVDDISDRHALFQEQGVVLLFRRLIVDGEEMFEAQPERER